MPRKVNKTLTHHVYGICYKFDRYFKLGQPSNYMSNRYFKLEIPLSSQDYLSDTGTNFVKPEDSFVKTLLSYTGTTFVKLGLFLSNWDYFCQARIIPVKMPLYRKELKSNQYI